MRMMDLDDLHIFRCVVREGGVTRAANRLHRVPSNVTTRIKQLEERLGVTLFRRQGREPGPHRRGADPAGTCRAAAADGGHGRAGDAQRRRAGRAAAGFPGKRGGRKAAADPVGLSRPASGRSIELQTGTTRALLRLLERFEIEAAFVSEPFERRSLSSVPAFDEELVLITAEGRSGAPPGRPIWAGGRSWRSRMAARTAAADRVAGRRRRLARADPGPGLVSRHRRLRGRRHRRGDRSGGGARPCRSGTAVDRHPLPARFRVNRTHLVWSGEASAPLQALMALLPRPDVRSHTRAGNRTARQLPPRQ